MPGEERVLTKVTFRTEGDNYVITSYDSLGDEIRQEMPIGSIKWFAVQTQWQNVSYGPIETNQTDLD